MWDRQIAFLTHRFWGGTHITLLLFLLNFLSSQTISTADNIPFYSIIYPTYLLKLGFFQAAFFREAKTALSQLGADVVNTQIPDTQR